MPKQKKKREYKTKKILQSQTPEQKVLLGLEIERLLTTPGKIKGTVEHFIGKYGYTLERKLGLTEDDLRNDIREQLWKALSTHDPVSGTANIDTWSIKFIKNRFGVLYDRSTLEKYNSVEYFSDVAASSSVDRDYLETDETGETLLERRQEFMRDLVALSSTDRIIYRDLILGFSLNEMVRRNKLTLPEVIGAVKRIDERVRNRRNSTE